MLDPILLLADAAPTTLLDPGHLWGAIGTLGAAGVGGITALWRWLDRRETARQAREDAREARDAARMTALEDQLKTAAAEQLKREREDGRGVVSALERATATIERNSGILERAMNHLDDDAARPRRNTR